MKRCLLMGALVCAAVTAQSEIYIFRPDPRDLDDLDHKYYYSWGIDWELPEDEVIVGAALVIRDIYDWREEEDYLYTHLLDNPALGVESFYDNEGGGDAWNGAGPLVGVYSDPLGGVDTGFDLVYNFSDLGLIDDLNAALADGRFGFGFDPDCHYFNKGAKFIIKTEVVPEPASMVALGLGALGLVRRRRRAGR